MRSRSMIVMLCLAVVLTAGQPAALAVDRVAFSPLTLDRIEAAEAAGVITHDEAALNKIYRIFDESLLDPRLTVEGEPPLKNATILIASILNDESVGLSVTLAAPAQQFPFFVHGTESLAPGLSRFH